MESFAEEVLVEVKEPVAKHCDVSAAISTGLWTSGARDSYISITVYFNIHARKVCVFLDRINVINELTTPSCLESLCFFRQELNKKNTYITSSLQYSTLHYTTLHFNTIYNTALRYTRFHYNTLHYLVYFNNYALKVCVS